MVELAANGNSALLSSYLTGLAGTVYNGATSSNSYGFTPAIAVDNAGNIALVGDVNNASDFPITISSANPEYAFLAKISPSALPFTWSTPASINFANQYVGISTSVYNYSNTANTVTIRNISATAVTISSIQASPSSIFSESDACSGTIPAGATCVLTINFTPAAAGVRTGTITVNSNASNSPTVVSLTATGFDSAFTQASATSLSFGNQNVGSTSAPQTVTLTNIGDESANAPNIYANTGTDFTVLNNCSIPFAPGATCTATVTFSPTQTGLRTDTLYMTAAGPTVTIPLSARALPPAQMARWALALPPWISAPKRLASRPHIRVCWFKTPVTFPLASRPSRIPAILGPTPPPAAPCPSNSTRKALARCTRRSRLPPLAFAQET